MPRVPRAPRFAALAVSSLALSGLVGVPSALAADCSLPPKGVPLKTEGRTPVLHNACGQPFQAGYRLEGTTLHFPSGATHALPQATEAEAEETLRIAYGLVGPRDALVRTRWPE
ncbi:hypothetical protein F1188_08725 [Roseospira marina]|uniref:Uncharacterized protein n=1 Tax=Roseospira marina TaxID=140057 RepID=A0A5M6ICT7_9PROT|nr:hypothetical protein [Roseospira marina]KAA5606081.1 hypothetical protein F1188_08725 [Roseospira marina]MBB4313053.1 hypothetical protein [Roseospira marina]MBB5086206.1 hypothetical protein [Roseospira marina]